MKSFFSHEEGRVRRAGTALIYETFLKDHLGNVRVMFTDADGDGWVDPADDDEVLQVDHFYPFGLRMAGISTAPAVPNFYTFTGKEYQDELGLGWTDFGARMYDASVGRWNGVDILAEKYFSISPFGFALNNPVLFVDPFGMDTYYYDENGGFLRFERNDKKNEIHFMNRDKFEQIVLNALMTPMAPIETDLSTSLNEASTFFIGENTAKGLRSHERNTQKNRREYGGFMYYTNENKEVRLHECAECPINEDAQIGLDGYSPKLLPEDVFFVGSWHTHPKGRNGEIIFDYRPSRSDYDAGKFFINRIQVKPRSDELTSINGGPGVIGYSGGVILFQHSLNAKGNVAYRPTSNDFRSFSYDWFSKSGGSVAYFRFLVFGPMAAEFAKPVKE